MKKTITFFATLLLLSACGPSAEEMAAREKIKTDSIAQAAKQELLDQQAKAEKVAALKQQLIELKAQLAGEEARLESVQQFHLLRSAARKAEEVANQTRVVEELRAQIEEVSRQYADLE